MHRRHLLKLAGFSAASLALGGAGAAAWLAGPPAPLSRFATLAEARQWLMALSGDPTARSLTAWPLAQVFEHAAQSIEYSLTGYPLPKPPLFQATAGRVAFAAFDRAGAMRHDLVEPIPGAPVLSAGDYAVAALRLDAALVEFERHAGPLQPHFAYGALDKAQYTRAHLMHLANHAEQIAAG